MIYRYALSQDKTENGRKFTVTAVNEVPKWAKLDIAQFDCVDNRFWGFCCDFTLFSTRKLNQKKLYALFKSLKKIGLNSEINIGASYELI